MRARRGVERDAMNIDANHRAVGVPYDPVLKTRAAMPIRRFLVMHFTAGATGKSSIDFWRKSTTKASAHFVIERDGTIIQCVPTNIQAWHAGTSKWTDPNTGITYSNLNSCSIGIELANAGDSDGALSWARKQPWFKSIRAKHKLGGPIVEWEDYYAPQLEAAEELARALKSRYNLDDVIGHEDIRIPRGEKRDPGPAFPMRQFRAVLGITRELP